MYFENLGYANWGARVKLYVFYSHWVKFKPYKVGRIIICLTDEKKKKLRPREVKCLDQGHNDQ